MTIIIKRVLFILLLAFVAVSMPVEVRADVDELNEILADTEEEMDKLDGIKTSIASQIESLGIDPSKEIEVSLEKEAVEKLISSLQNGKKQCEALIGLFEELLEGIEDNYDDLDTDGDLMADYDEGIYDDTLDDLKALKNKYTGWIKNAENISTAPVVVEEESPAPAIAFIEINEDLQLLPYRVDNNLSTLELLLEASKGTVASWGVDLDGNRRKLLNALEDRRKIYVGGESVHSLYDDVKLMFTAQKLVNELVEKNVLDLADNEEFERAMASLQGSIRLILSKVTEIENLDKDILKLLEERIKERDEEEKEGWRTFLLEEKITNKSLLARKAMLEEAKKMVEDLKNSVKKGSLPELKAKLAEGIENFISKKGAKEMPVKPSTAGIYPPFNPENVKKVVLDSEGNIADNVAYLNVINDVTDEFISCEKCTVIKIAATGDRRYSEAIITHIKDALVNNGVSEDSFIYEDEIPKGSEEDSYIAISIF